MHHVTSWQPAPAWAGRLLRVVSGLDKDQRGITGLETAIVLLAFVVVASVLAFAILSTGLVTLEKSKETAVGSLAEASGTLMVLGGVVGISNSNLTALDKVKFTLSSGTKAGQAVEVSTAATVLSYFDEEQALILSGSDWTATWLIGFGPMLDPGEQVEIAVNLSGLSPPPGKGTAFTLRVKGANGPTVVIPSATPAELMEVVELTSRSGSVPTPTPVPTTVLTSVADAEGRENNPSTNFGTATWSANE